jgi:hypothetical protein
MAQDAAGVVDAQAQMDEAAAALAAGGFRIALETAEPGDEPGGVGLVVPRGGRAERGGDWGR